LLRLNFFSHYRTNQASFAFFPFKAFVPWFHLLCLHSERGVFGCQFVL
jgi:hypothetical protein